MRFRVTFGKQAVLSLVFCLSFAFTASCAKRSRATATTDGQDGRVLSQTEASNISLLDINSATVDELEKLPGVGESIAKRIVEHRERYGSFRRPEHLIIVRGISEGRYKAMHPFIKAE